jgi:hypothetical protein
MWNEEATNTMCHLLRNPYGHPLETIRVNREASANLIESAQKQIDKQEALIEELVKALKVFCEQFETPAGHIYPDQILNAYKSVERGDKVLKKAEQRNI